VLTNPLAEVRYTHFSRSRMRYHPFVADWSVRVVVFLVNPSFRPAAGEGALKESVCAQAHTDIHNEPTGAA